MNDEFSAPGAAMTDRPKFTPGPWGMQTVRTSCGVCHKIGPWPHKWRAGDTMSACIYDDYPSPPIGTDTMIANAYLIAAAPDMYAALEAMDAYWLEMLPDGPPDDEGHWLHPNSINVWRGIRAALAKAQGQA